MNRLSNPGKGKFLNFFVSVVLFVYSVHLVPASVSFFTFGSLAFLGLLTGRIQYSSTALVLAVFLILYGVFAYSFKIFSLSHALYFIGTPLLLYLIGDAVIVKKNSADKAFYYIYLVLVGLFLFGMLSLARTIYLEGVGSLMVGQRLVYSVWTGALLNATNMGAYFTMGLSMLGFIVLVRGRQMSFFSNLLSIFIVSVSVLGLLFLGNRTGAAIGAVSLLMPFFVLFYSKQESFKGVLKTGLAGAILIALAVVIIQYNLWGLGEEFYDSVLITRLMEARLGEDSRVLAWEYAWAGLLQYPMGGQFAYMPLEFAHNLWLDVGYTVGFFPMVVLIVFSVMAFVHLLRLLRSRTAPLKLRALAACVMIAMLLNFFVEPVLEGLFIHFSIFCFIVGIISKYNRLSRQSLTQARFNI